MNRSENIQQIVVVDSRVGSKLEEIYTNALRLAPQLGRVAIRTDSEPEDQCPYFFMSHPEGLDKAHIGILYDHSKVSEPQYRMLAIDRFVASGLLQDRNASSAQLLAIAFAHELGHAYDFSVMSELYGPAGAYGKMQLQIAYGRQTLPLKMPSSAAIDSNKPNLMLMRQLWPKTWTKRLLENTIAYSQLSMEQAADSFAAKIL